MECSTDACTRIHHTDIVRSRFVRVPCIRTYVIDSAPTLISRRAASELGACERYASPPTRRRYRSEEGLPVLVATNELPEINITYPVGTRRAKRERKKNSPSVCVSRLHACARNFVRKRKSVNLIPPVSLSKKKKKMNRRRIRYFQTAALMTHVLWLRMRSDK